MFNISRKRKNNAISGYSMPYGKLRLQEDIKELKLNDSCTFHFPNHDNLMNFEVTVCPEEGYYENAHIVFSINVPDNYPHSPPKVKCVTKILHPNIDKDGNICLNILREDWTPVLSINSIICGLQYLLNEPSAEDVLNEEAGRLLKTNEVIFAKKVRKVLTDEGAYKKY